MLNYKYSLSDLENMLPWERDIYVHFVKEAVQEKNDKLKQQQAGGNRTIEYA